MSPAASRSVHCAAAGSETIGIAGGRSLRVIRIIRARDEAASWIDAPAGLHGHIASSGRFEFPFGEGLEDRSFGNRLDFLDDPEVDGITIGSNGELDFAVGKREKAIRKDRVPRWSGAPEASWPRLLRRSWGPIRIF